MPASSVSKLFLEFSRTTLIEEYWPRLRSCVESLSDEQVWWRLNDARNRPAEFAERRHVPAAELLQHLDSTLRRASDVLSRLTEDELRATYDIQGYTVSGLHAVYHVVEHFGMHYGQIVYITKLVSAKDLGFYRELDQTGRAPVERR